jgi:hypothetical protein
LRNWTANNKKETLAVLTMVMLSSAILNAGDNFSPSQMYLTYSYGKQVEVESSRFQQQTITVEKSPSIELVDLVVEEDVVEVADESLVSESIEKIKSLSTDANFQNDLQYAINPRLFSRIPNNPNNVSSIFSSFQAEAIFNQ